MGGHDRHRSGGTITDQTNVPSHSTGDLKWVYDLPNQTTPNTGVVVGDHDPFDIDTYRVYFGAEDGKLYCVQVQPGTPFTTSLVWTYSNGSHIVGAPVLDLDSNNIKSVFFTDKQKRLRCVNAETGTLTWTTTLGGIGISPPLSMLGGLYVAVDLGNANPPGKLVVVSNDRTILAERTTQPGERLTGTPSGSYPGSAPYDPVFIYVTTLNGKLVKFERSPSNLLRRWAYPAPGGTGQLCDQLTWCTLWNSSRGYYATKQGTPAKGRVYAVDLDQQDNPLTLWPSNQNERIEVARDAQGIDHSFGVLTKPISNAGPTAPPLPYVFFGTMNLTTPTQKPAYIDAVDNMNGTGSGWLRLTMDLLSDQINSTPVYIADLDTQYLIFVTTTFKFYMMYPGTGTYANSQVLLEPIGYHLYSQDLALDARGSVIFGVDNTQIETLIGPVAGKVFCYWGP